MNARKQPVRQASFTPTQFCERHGIPLSTFYRWMSEGKISFIVGPSGRRRIPASEDAKLAGAQS